MSINPRTEECSFQTRTKRVLNGCTAPGVNKVNYQVDASRVFGLVSKYPDLLVAPYFSFQNQAQVVASTIKTHPWKRHVGPPRMVNGSGHGETIHMAGFLVGSCVLPLAHFQLNHGLVPRILGWKAVQRKGTSAQVPSV